MTHLLQDSFKGTRKENHEVKLVKDEANTETGATANYTACDGNSVFKGYG